MAEEAFKPGDVVQVKSGGPAMTVQRAQQDGTLWCVWFAKDDNKSSHGEAFPAAVLKKYVDPYT